MARTSWLDETSDLPILDQKAQELESFTAAMADGVIDEKELEHQQERLVTVMKEVESKLDDELHEKVTELLVELTAYDIMRLLRELQTERARIVFSK